jgi:hypothetical protein
MPLKIAELPRNDVDAAVRYLEQQLDAGAFTADDGQSLMMLQDDPDALGEAVAAMIKRRKGRGEPIGPFK